MKRIVTIAYCLLTGFALFAQPVKTELVNTAGVYQLYRGGLPYVIKGAAANNYAASVADFGGNTIRTYSVNDSTGKWLDSCYANGIAVCLGLGIKKGIQLNYHDTGAVNTQFREMKEQVLLYKDHPAVLLWAIGNEADASYPDTAIALWTAINDIAAMIHTEDSNHLVTTVLVNSAISKVQTIIAEVPELDILSINSYAPNIPGVLSNLQSAGWTKPYMITEFGPRGTWQMNPEPARIMPWGGLVEQTSSEKAVVYRQLLETYIEANRTNNCLGGFVFLWGYQSSGDVMTWYGLHTRLGESFGGADEMQKVWTGSYPANRAPVISTRSDFTCNGKRAEDTVILEANSVNLARVFATDPENDSLIFEWLLIQENATMGGGDPAASLPSFSGFLVDQHADSCHFKAPAITGNYRLYVYVHDGHGKLASAAIPFKVIPSSIGQWIVSTATGGNWNSGSSWAGGVVPSNADSVEIATGSTVTINTSPTVAFLQVKGTLTFNTTSANTLNTGNLLINSGANLNAFNGSSGRKITVRGHLLNDGVINLSKAGTTLTMASSGDSTILGGTGTYTGGVIRNLTIDNPYGVSLQTTISIPGVLSLSDGVFRNGSYLTLDNTNVAGSSTSTFVQLQRSQVASLTDPYTLGTTAALYVQYIENTNYPSQVITEGHEIPSSRSFHNITSNNPDGVHLLDNLTLKSSNAALTLTNGIIHLAAGKTITCSNTSYAGTTGTNSSYVDGAVALSAGTTPVARTFPVGDSIGHRKIMLTGVASSSGTVVLRFAIDSASGTPGAGVAALSAVRRWAGTVVSGSLSQYTSISLDYGTDDGGPFTLIARASANNGTYTALGPGSSGTTQVTSATGTYTQLGWYSPASASGSGTARSLITPAELLPEASADVYPNPAHDQVSVRSQLTDGFIQVRLINPSGQILQHQQTYLRKGSKFTLRFNNIVAGLYLLVLEGYGSRQVFRIRVQ